MPLLKTTAELQLVASVEANLKPVSFIPYVRQAEQQYLRFILGSPFMATIQTQYDGSTLSTENTALMPYIHDVIGPLAVYHMVPNTALRIGPSGVSTTSSNDFAPASGAEIYFMRIECRNKGLNALDALYDYLEANKGTYTAWAASDAFKGYKKYFISSALQFQQYADISSSRLIFAKMVPMMAQMEKRYIRSTITDALFNDLKTKWAADSLSDIELRLLDDLCNAIALFTYQTALMDRNLVEEIMVVNSSRSENFKKNKEDFNDFAALTDRYGELGEAALADAVAYMNSIASSSVLPLWFNSGKYTDPNAPAVIDKYNNATSKGTFFAT